MQQRIFDPFFTTKLVGKGSRMGRSSSYQIATEKHDGKLKCFSTDGGGTEFVIQILIQRVASTYTKSNGKGYRCFTLIPSPSPQEEGCERQLPSGN
ncbi:MAG: ATP-binding protein [Stenomitos frigidus ULC029]